MVVRGAASAAQDGRFSRKSKKDMSNFKIPPEYNLKIDFSKLVWPPLEAWVMKRVTELLKGAEDEVLVGTILESLKVETKAKELHYELVPFLCNNTTLFVKELWSMLHSASNNATGIPDRLQEEEIARLKQRQEQAAALQEKLRIARERQAVPRGDGPRRPRSRSGSPRRDGQQNGSPRGNRRDDYRGGGYLGPPRDHGPGRRGDDRGGRDYGGGGGQEYGGSGSRDYGGGGGRHYSGGGERDYRGDRGYRSERDYREPRRRDDHDPTAHRGRGYDGRDYRSRRDGPGDGRHERPPRGWGGGDEPMARDERAAEGRRRMRRENDGAEVRREGRDDRRDDVQQRRRYEANGDAVRNVAERRRGNMREDPARSSPALRDDLGRDADRLERTRGHDLGDRDVADVRRGRDGGDAEDRQQRRRTTEDVPVSDRRIRESWSDDADDDRGVVEELQDEHARVAGATRRGRDIRDHEEDEGGDVPRSRNGRRRSRDGGKARTPEEDGGRVDERRHSRDEGDMRTPGADDDEDGRYVEDERSRGREGDGRSGERKERRRHKGDKKHTSDKDKKSKKSHKHKHHKRSRHASPRAEASPRPMATSERRGPLDREDDGHTPPPKRPRNDSGTPPAAEGEAIRERQERSAEWRETDAPRGHRGRSASEGRGHDAASPDSGTRARSGAEPPPECGGEGGEHAEVEGVPRTPRTETGSRRRRDREGGSLSTAAVDLEELREEARRAQHHARRSEGRGGGSGSSLE